MKQEGGNTSWNTYFVYHLNANTPFYIEKVAPHNGKGVLKYNMINYMFDTKKKQSQQFSNIFVVT